MEFWLENWAMTQLREYAKTDPAFAREIVDTLNNPAFCAEHAAKNLVARFHAAVAWADFKRAYEVIKSEKTDRKFARAVWDTFVNDKAFLRVHPPDCPQRNATQRLSAAVLWTRRKRHRAKDAGVDAAISGAMAKAGW